MKTITKIALLATLSLGSTAAIAAPKCTTSSWQITGAIQSANYTYNAQNPASGITPLSSPISATSCYGVNVGNEGDTLNPNPNLGYLGDGLLNGEDGLIDPYYFIQPGQKLGLEDPDKLVDPGWIMLGQIDEIQSNGMYSMDPSQVVTGPTTSFWTNEVVTYTQTRTFENGGTWTLSVNKDIVSFLSSQGLLSRSYFDHLAFSVKAANYWAVYDFDFNELSGFDLLTPYTFTGTWNTFPDFKTPGGNPNNTNNTNNTNSHAISHISIWARDPITTTNQVSEPATLAMLGIGLLAAGFATRRRS